MYLKQVEIQNFRNLKALVGPSAIKLSPGLNVIIGPNNIGKSNLLQAIKVALGPSAAEAEENLWLSREDWYIGPDGVQVSDPIQIDLVFSGLSQDQQAAFLEILNYNPTAPAQSTASIHFEATWSEVDSRAHYRRWGGGRVSSEASVPEEVLQAIRVTFLSALRDAERALAPGRKSKLGRLLELIASPDERQRLEEIIKNANQSLHTDQIVQRAESHISTNLTSISGPRFKQEAVIRTSPTRFERIVHGLRLLLVRPAAAAPLDLEELGYNGLGYNNLLYIATVLSELSVSRSAAYSALMVEEPEAHLHPQLQVLLADFLARAPTGEQAVQTIVTTHSPTIAARVSPTTMRVLHRKVDGSVACVSIEDCTLSEQEIPPLRRMLDVTKASLFFANGIILVEGISEALLLPVLANLLGISLEQNGISVIPICGVSFETIAKLFDAQRVNIRVAIITDGDSEKVYGTDGDWRTASPKLVDGKPDVCARTQALFRSFQSNALVKVFCADVTLEYALACAGAQNAELICQAWEALHARTPQTFNTALLTLCGADINAKALAVWRGICVANVATSKAELAQQLAGQLSTGGGGFVVPDCIKDAIVHVTGVQPTTNAATANAGTASNT